MSAPLSEIERFNILKERICFHCGEDCNDEIVMLKEKNFCCHGCKMVYEILNSKDLCQYYDLSDTAGISLKGKDSPQFAWLDDEVITSQLIDFQEDKFTKVSFYLPAIHCAACVWLLENLYKFNPGISTSKINFIRKEISLSFDNSKISLRQIAELLSSIGYVPEINLGDTDQAKRKVVDKKLIYQIGVTGFAFGNIMLLSFPEYLGLNAMNGIGFQWWFGWLNILLALPVVFYGGKDYLRSAWLSLKQRHLNIDVPISIGMLTLFGRSLFEIGSGVGAGYLDALAGLVFFLLIGKWFQQITYNHLSFERDYKSYFPVAALLENGTTIPVQNLKAGDIIIVKNKELIPTDGFLLNGNASIDYSFVTGESELIPKNKGERIFAGGKQMGDALQIQVTKTVSQSYLTQLWNDASFAPSSSQNEVLKTNQTQLLADRVGKYFTYFILSVAFATLLYWLPIDVSKAVNAFTAVLIIACPCAVALSIPFTFGNAIRILGKHGFYLKNTQVIEYFQQATSVVFDKTGTITSVINNNEISYFGKELSTLEKNNIASLLAQSSHPKSRQVFQFLNPQKNSLFSIEKFEEIEGKGLQGVVNQSLIKIGSADFTNSEVKNKGSVYVQIDGKNIGYFSIKNKYRKGFEEVIYFFNKKNKTYLLSGDNANTKNDLQPFFNKNLHYFQSPKDKLDFIKKLQLQGEKVMMLGDGLNDAGALQQSEVGIVIAEDTNNFTPASDAILAASSFSKLPRFTKYIEGCIRLVYMAYGLALVYNVIGLSFAVQAKLSPVIAAILMPLSSITIVLFGVLSGTWLSWKLGLGDKNHN